MLPWFESAMGMLAYMQETCWHFIFVVYTASLILSCCLTCTIRRVGKSGNADFALSVARWTLQDQGVLRAENLRHRCGHAGDETHA